LSLTRAYVKYITLIQHHILNAKTEGEEKTKNSTPLIKNRANVYKWWFHELIEQKLRKIFEGRVEWV